MDIVYAPWRKEYFGSKDRGCVFCDIINHSELDKQNRVVYRNESLFIVMNRYPYTPGHLLIIPNAHISSPINLDSKVWCAMFEMAQRFTNVLYNFGADGINMGMNINSSGGAGIPEHLHLHLLPRWTGDTNFFTSVCESRTYGIDFDEVYEKICEISKQYL